MDQEVFHILFESLLQVTIGPFLHGVIIQNYFSYYNSQYLFSRTLTEIIILFLKIFKPSAWSIIMIIPPLITFFCSLTDEIFGLGISDIFVIDKLYRVSLHIFVMTIFSESYKLFMFIIYTLPVVWTTNVTSFQWISIIFSRTLHWIFSSAIYLLMLTLKTWLVPYLLLAGQSPVILRSSDNPLVQQPINQKNDIALFRVVGEDVHLTCRTDTPLHVINSELTWMHNGSIVQNDKQHISSFRKLENLYILQLVIRHMKVEDFGEYRCLQRKTHLRLEACSWNGEDYCVPDLAPNEVVVKSVTLKLFSKELQSIPARVGTVFNMQNVLNYHILRDDKLELLHTVNGQNHSDLCSNLRHVSGHIPTQHQIEYRRPSCSFIKGEYICNISFAICVSSFGIHEFTLVKQTNNSNTHVHHPLSYLIRPEGMIMSTKEAYVLYDKLLAKLLSSDKETDTELRNLTFQLIEVKERIELRKSETLSIFFGVLMGLLLNLLLTSLAFIFDKLSFDLVYLFEENKYRLGLAAEKKKSIVTYEYDIFVSFCDTDRNFVCRFLIPFLETGLHLKVCQPDIDVRPGHPLWSEYIENISKSKKIIVVLSPDYLQDPFCNQMQFSMLIVPMLCTSDKTFQDVFLIEHQQCEVPALYESLLPICNWYVHCDEDMLKQEITVWIKTSDPSVHNIFNKILFKMFMLIEQFI